MVEQRSVKALVAGSIPASGANKLDTNSDFEDERVRHALPAGRSPSPATGGAGRGGTNVPKKRKSDFFGKSEVRI